MTETLGQRIKRLRVERELNQVEIHAATGIDRTYLSRMENKDVASQWEKMCALADLLEVSLDYLRHGSQIPTFKAGSEVIEDPDERSLLRMWRAMDEPEKAALRAVAERLASKADPSNAA
ncbi:helix-turn-helix domain-containing protein [Acetobacter sp. UBA5411]|uniref:helix-turn-helix domain-containing protein n=1 Tax=Acetobacter sp. UBA5411 TaxID=1945905 RepID=UPI0025C2619A|nr:helix-turn-helix domain-containing protein [Acetobacter sp. UBA5411]